MIMGDWFEAETLNACWAAARPIMLHSKHQPAKLANGFDPIVPCSPSVLQLGDATIHGSVGGKGRSTRARSVGGQTERYTCTSYMCVSA
jgi:hypothetical protein